MIKKHYLRYFIGLFFIVLFSFKGIISVCPALSMQLAKIASIEIFIESEMNGAKKNAEEKNETEIKELFENNDHFNIGNKLHIVSNKNIIANNIARNQDVFLPVITPPPEQL